MHNTPFHHVTWNSASLRMAGKKRKILQIKKVEIHHTPPTTTTTTLPKIKTLTNKIIHNINVLHMNKLFPARPSPPNPTLICISLKSQRGLRDVHPSLIYETQIRLSQNIGLSRSDRSDMEYISVLGRRRRHYQSSVHTPPLPLK